MNISKDLNQPSVTTIPIKKKLFILTGGFTYGGTEKFLFDFLKVVDKNKFDIFVGCHKRGGPFLPNLIRTPFELGLMRYSKPIRVPLIFIKLVRYLRSQRFDILYSTHFETNVYLVLSSLFLQNPAVVIGYRGLSRGEGFWRRCMNREVVKIANRIIVNSESVRKMLLDTTGVSSDKIHVIYNGIDLHRGTNSKKHYEKLRKRFFGNRAKSKVIGSVGRLHKIKGHIYLIEAFAKLCGDHPDTLLAIAGDGVERQQLEGLTKRLGIDSRVVFLGYRQEIKDFLDAIDIFVLPSLSESFPNALLEAMAAGLPCAATAVGGVTEIIENTVDGILVPAADVFSLYCAIRDLLSSPDQNLKQLGGRARAKASSFTRERMVQEVEAVFEDALKVNI